MVSYLNGIQATYLGEEKIEISQMEKKLCKLYSIKTNVSDEKNVNHHILLLDVSASMKDNIDELKLRIKTMLEALKSGRNNYVSIIIYSGHNESIRIVNAVKCDKTSYNMTRIFETIDKELYIRSVTVMSEPLEQAIDIVKRLGDICNKHHIALFTDGCLLPYEWSVKEEKEKVLKVADICKEKGIFLDVIGFGKYYDRKFLKEIIDRASMGSFNHVDEIKEYYTTMVDLAKSINNKQILEFTVSNKDYFILNSSIRYKNKNTIRTSINYGELVIAVFSQDLIINDERVHGDKDLKLSDERREDLLYSLALYHIIEEDIESAELVLAKTGDIAAYSYLSNCYSFVEKGKAIKRLSNLLENKNKRFEKGKVKIKVNDLDDEPLCLLEVLQEILLDKESKLLWDYSYKYKRIGIKSKIIEDKYEFIRPKSGYGEVVGVSIGAKKLNIGVKVKINGEVINRENKLKLDAHIYRDYNLILNGNINTEFMWCKLSKDLKRKYKSEKIIKSTTKVYGQEVVTLDLRKLKSTNKRLLKSTRATDIAQYLYRIEELSCKQWALNNLIKKLSLEKDVDINNLSEAEKVKLAYRVDKSGLYKPLAVNNHHIKDSYEVYLAKVLEWRIEKFPKKKEQEKALKYYSSLKNNDSISLLDTLIDELKVIKKEKLDLEYKVNIVRLSCGLTEKSIFIWEDEIEKDKREWDKILNINAVVGEKVNISMKKVNNIKLRQDSYIILTKCE